MKVSIEIEELEKTCEAIAYSAGRFYGSGSPELGKALMNLLEQIRENTVDITDLGYDQNH